MSYHNPGELIYNNKQNISTYPYSSTSSTSSIAGPQHNSNISNTTSNYYIALIIITIIGFTLSIVLSFYFVYVPAQRSAASFDDLYKRGTEIVDNAIDIGEDVNQTAMLTSDFMVALCTGIEDGKGQLGNLQPSFKETCEFILNGNNSS